MARLGLGNRSWKCVFANDNSTKKALTYRMAFREGDKLKRCDVAHIATDDLPGQATPAWASFPCQDLSVAGTGAGLNGERSGTFHYFWDLIEQLQAQERQPRIVALENVVGALTSHSGKDFQTILERMATTGYRTGALVIDAVHFLPQSRPRLFIVGVREDCDIPVDLISQIAGKALAHQAHATSLSISTGVLTEQMDLVECSETKCPCRRLVHSFAYRRGPYQLTHVKGDR